MATKRKGKYLVFTDTGKFVHRWVAWKKYGNAIDGMKIHHIDGDTLNNDKSNLLLVSNEDHHQIHQHENKRKLLSSLIILFSIIYIVLAIVAGFIFPSIQTFAINVMRIAVLVILVIAIELRYNVLATTLRRPNERVFREK